MLKLKSPRCVVTVYEVALGVAIKSVRAIQDAGAIWICYRSPASAFQGDKNLVLLFFVSFGRDSDTATLSRIGT